CRRARSRCSNRGSATARVAAEPRRRCRVTWAPGADGSTSHASWSRRDPSNRTRPETLRGRARRERVECRACSWAPWAKGIAVSVRGASERAKEEHEVLLLAPRERDAEPTFVEVDHVGERRRRAVVEVRCARSEAAQPGHLEAVHVRPGA